MLGLEDFSEIQDDISALDQMLTNEIIEHADAFDLEADDETQQTFTVTIYDEAKNVLGTCQVFNADVAAAYLDDVFEIDWPDDDTAGSSPWGQGS